MFSIRWRAPMAWVLGGCLGLLCLPWATAQTPAPQAAPTNEKKVTKANFQKLKTGMTVEEVEAILGPGQELTADQFPAPRTRIQLRMKQSIEAGAKALKWQEGRRIIIAIFPNGKMTATSTHNLD